MIKNLKSFIFLLLVGVFGMLLTVSCGADDVLSDVEDATGTDEPASADETPQWTEQTKMAAKELVGKWQRVSASGKAGVYDEQLEVLENGTMKYYQGGKVSEATYSLRNDWNVREWEENLYDDSGVDSYGNPSYYKGICKYKELSGSVFSPEWSLYDLEGTGKQYDISCSICMTGETNDHDILTIVRDYPDMAHFLNPAMYFSRIE